MATVRNFTADGQVSASFNGPGSAFLIYFTGSPSNAVFTLRRQSLATGAFEVVADGSISEGVISVAETSVGTYQLEMRSMGRAMSVRAEIRN